MSTASNEQIIVDSIIQKLSAVAETKLGYSATGLDDDLSTPAILVQLESLSETSRQGDKVNLSCSSISVP